MTDQQRDQRFVTVWNGTSYLLPPYEGRSTLSTAIEKKYTRKKLISRPPRRFSPAVKARAVELYEQQHLTMQAIARIFQTSKGRISCWVKHRHIRNAGARVGGPSIPERRREGEIQTPRAPLNPERTR